MGSVASQVNGTNNGNGTVGSSGEQPGSGFSSTAHAGAAVGVLVSAVALCYACEQTLKHCTCHRVKKADGTSSPPERNRDTLPLQQYPSRPLEGRQRKLGQ